MARTALAVQTIVRAGIEPDFTEAANADGEKVELVGNVFIFVNNGSGSPIDITFLIPKLYDGEPVADGGRKETLAATTDKIYGPFPVDPYIQADGNLYINFSAVTTVAVAAFKV